MGSLNILVVDDDRDAAEGLAEVFQMEGHAVTLAHTGEDAIKHFAASDFDIAFMDVMMPGLNGVESFVEIRKIKPDAKVFMMTGYSLQQLLDEAVENGALGILNKPVAMDEVLAILDRIEPGGIILIADDDPEFGEGIKEMLAAHDYDVALVTNGQDALDRVSSGGVDILILDLQLPVLDGLAVYKTLKARNILVPTIIVTGYAAEEEPALDALREMAVSGILTKPFDPAMLLQALRRHSH